MNKKFTPRLIKIIFLECVMLILTVTAIGGAVITHNEFKATAYTVSKTENEVSETQSSETTTATTTQPAIDTDYEYYYAGFSPVTINPDTNVSKILLNTSNILPENYQPTLAEAVEGSDVMLDYRAAPYYQAMYDAALKDGITLTPVSGYRSVERQKQNFENRIEQYMNDGLDKKEATIEAAKIIMLPGSSEHNAGLAMDICSLSESFEDTEEFEWLSENAPSYGFILRYPKDEIRQKITGVVYEPWHYRFVGVDAAKEITQRGITLEEYLGKAKV